MTSISDRAHARDLAALDAEKRRLEAAYPKAYSLLDPLAKRYVARYRQLGNDDPLVRLLQTVAYFVLDEIKEGREVTADVARAVLAFLEQA
jgi:hypothetical protein